MTGTEDAQPARDVAEALAWFRDNPDRVRSVEGRLRSGRHAATIVRAALAAEPDDVVHDAVWSLEMLVARYQDREESAVIDPMQGKAFGVVASQLAPVVERLSTALAGARPAAEPDDLHCPGCGNAYADENLCMPSACQWEGTEEEAGFRPAGDATTEVMPWSTQDDAMRVAHGRPTISACSWDRHSFCDCPVGDVVGRLWNAGMLKKETQR